MGQELKQAVQFRVPVSWMKPNTHWEGSQFVGPLISHLRQLVAQGLQYPSAEVLVTAAEYLGAQRVE
jgi:hypothetical protein